MRPRCAGGGAGVSPVTGPLVPLFDSHQAVVFACQCRLVWSKTLRRMTRWLRRKSCGWWRRWRASAGCCRELGSISRPQLISSCFSSRDWDPLVSYRPSSSGDVRREFEVQTRCDFTCDRSASSGIRPGMTRVARGSPRASEERTLPESELICASAVAAGARLAEQS